MKRWILIGLALGVCASAMAQTGDDPERQRRMAESATGFGFRVGAYLPLDSDVRDEESMLFDFGIEYEFVRPFFGRNGDTFLSLDFTTAKDIDMWTIALNHRIYTGESMFNRDARAYLYGGLGVHSLDAGPVDGSSFALRAGIGSELNFNSFVEAGFVFGGDIDGVNPSGIQLSIGYRFR